MSVEHSQKEWDTLEHKLQGSLLGHQNDQLPVSYLSQILGHLNDVQYLSKNLKESILMPVDMSKISIMKGKHVRP